MRIETWETDGGAADRVQPRSQAATLPVRVSAPMSTEDQRDAARIQRLPKYRNDVAAPEILIGARELQCIGVSPPHDHPHIYLSVGDADEVVCPYCATRYRFAPSLGPFETDPADCLAQEDL